MVVVGWYGKKEFNRLKAELEDNGRDGEEMGAVENDNDQLNTQQQEQSE